METLEIDIDGTKYYYKNGIKYTKEQVEFMTKMENKRTMKIFRYWYDKTYSDSNSEAFKSMMIRDMFELERELGYNLSNSEAFKSMMIRDMLELERELGYNLSK